MYYSNDELSLSEEISENGDVTFRPVIAKKLFHNNFVSSTQSILPLPRSSKLRKGTINKLNSLLYSITRAGGILYSIKDERLQFLFGQDRESGDYTDFGGSVQPSENWIVGALREIFEETGGVINYKLDDIQHCKAINCGTDIVIFIEVEDINTIASLIDINVKNHREISSSIILSLDKMYQLLNETPSKIYSRTGNLISMLPAVKLTRLLQKS